MSTGYRLYLFDGNNIAAVRACKCLNDATLSWKRTQSCRLPSIPLWKFGMVLAASASSASPQGEPKPRASAQAEEPSPAIAVDRRRPKVARAALHSFRTSPS
jgi:hypothetical protein